LSNRAYVAVVVLASALLVGCGGGGRLPDFDGDGIADVDDFCPEKAEDFNGLSDTDGCPDGSAAICLANQELIVEWEVDNGNGVPLSCAATPSSHVEVTTNANQVLLLGAACDDREFYNWIGSTGGQIPEGTTIVAADLVSDIDDSLLSFLDVPPSAQVAIQACRPAYYTFEFPLN
jgi:hypothetical protein